MIDFEESFVEKYPQRAFLLKYLHKALKKEHINWEDLTAINLTKIADYIKSKVSPNSAINYFGFLKAFLNLMSDDVELPTNKYMTILKSKRLPQQNVALTDEEIDRIYDYYQTVKHTKNKKTRVEADVLNLFLLECYCGARGCDTEVFTKDNVVNDKLTYISKKTQVLATMPVHYRFLELLKEKTDKKYLNTSKNRILKRVCKKCGINDQYSLLYRGKMKKAPKYEFIGMHSGRRSFASVLSMNGASVPEIQQFMGHRSMEMTMRYIKVDTKNASDAAMAFFKKDKKVN